MTSKYFVAENVTLQSHCITFTCMWAWAWLLSNSYFLAFLSPEILVKRIAIKNSMTISTKTTNPNVQELEILVHHFLRALLRFLVRDCTMNKRGPRKTSFRSHERVITKAYGCVKGEEVLTWRVRTHLYCIFSIFEYFLDKKEMKMIEVYIWIVEFWTQNCSGD